MNDWLHLGVRCRNSGHIFGAIHTRLCQLHYVWNVSIHYAQTTVCPEFSYSVVLPSLCRLSASERLSYLHWLPVHYRIQFKIATLTYKTLATCQPSYRCLGKLLSTWQTTFSLSLTADDVGCDLPVTEPVSFHGPITVSATEFPLLLDPEYGMLYLQNCDMTSALDYLGANWSRICLSRALNHGALWHIVFLHLRNILTYLLTYLYNLL